MAQLPPIDTRPPEATRRARHDGSGLFPPLEDCVTAARHLPASGLPAPYAIGGESAGAHLAVLTLLQVDHFAVANLTYGAYDLSGTRRGGAPASGGVAAVRR